MRGSPSDVGGIEKACVKHRLSVKLMAWWKILMHCNADICDNAGNNTFPLGNECILPISPLLAIKSDSWLESGNGDITRGMLLLTMFF
ncbi:MAG: hypothetical protein ABI171_19305 [Collimonas sp.]|uniref:hypothetical protein n=1 Tax=Collimonas sp. TaxID=1963772 RepID=UPI003264EF8C